MKRSPIPTIIGNEAAERFSFYGMRNILVAFLAGHMLLDLPETQRGPEAREIFHTFMMGVYFFPSSAAGSPTASGVGTTSSFG